MKKLIMGILLVLVLAVGVEAACTTNTLQLDQTGTFGGYTIKAKDIIHQDYAGGIRAAEFVIGGESTGSISEGNEYEFVSGKVIRVSDIYYQDYDGGILAVDFCIEDKASSSSIGENPQDCLDLASRLGYVPHHGVLGEEGWEVSLAETYGFKGLHKLKVITMNRDAITVDIDGERATLDVGESKVLSGVNFIVTRRQSGPIAYMYCAYETPETRLKLGCNGCVANGNCLPTGTRKVVDNEPSFCGFDKEMESQKREKATCQNNYECESNSCSKGKCESLGEEIEEVKKELEEQKGILNRIVNFLRRMFRFE